MTQHIRHIILLLLVLMISAGPVFGQKDFQLEADTPYTRLQIMTIDTTAGSSTYGLGMWRFADSLRAAFSDWDFLGFGTGRAPAFQEDSIETALDSMYVLFKGKDAGLATKIEMLQNGVLNFDKTGLYNTPSYLMSVNPFQSGANVGRMGMIAYASDNTYGAKKNQVFAFGQNPLDFDDSSTGLYFSFEDYYRPTSGPAYGEIHLVYNDSADVDHRIWTWFLNRLDPTLWTATYYVDQLSIRDPRALTSDSTYFKIEQVDGNQSQLVLMGANQSVSGGSRGVGQLVHSTNNTFEIYPYGSMPSSSEFYTRQFNVTNVNRLRIENDFGTTNGSSGQATSIIGREGSYGGVVGIGSGWGWDLISGALVIDSLEVASQFDLTTDPTWYEVGTTRRPDANTDDIFKSSGKVGIGETSPSNRLEIVAASASDDESILRLSGGSSGFSGANESDQEHSIIFDGCGFNGSAISQQDGAMIAMKKEGSWNEAANGVAGIKSALVFKTQNGTIASPSLTEKMRLGSTGQLTLNEYTTSNFNGGTASDSVLVVTSAGVVKKRNAASFGGGSSTTDLTIGGSGPSYTIESSTGTDVTVSNVFGLTLSEPVANTLGLAVDTTKVATPYDISGFGTMSSWLLAASGTGGTATISNGNTVTISETSGLDVTRSTNTISVALSIDEFSTDAAPEGDELLLMYDPSGTNHELIDINDLPYIAAEVDGSTTNELNTIEEGNVSVQTNNTNIDFQSLFDVATDGAGEVNISFDSGEATTVTTAQSDDHILMYDSGTGGTEKMLWSDFVIDLISFEEDNINEGTGNTIDLGTGLDGAYASAEFDITLDFNEFATDAATEGDEYVILYDPSAATQEKVAISSFGGADGNGIYTADGTTPTDLDVAVTDSLEFNGTLKIINDGNDYVGIGAQSPLAKLHVRGDNSIALFEQTGTVSSVDIKTRSNITGVTPPFVLGVYNKDTDIDLTGDYYQMGNITFSKASSSVAGGSINFNIGYDSTNLDGVLTLKSRESGATDGLVNVAGGLRYKWTSSSSSTYTLNTGDFGLTMNYSAGTKTVTLPDATSSIVGQYFCVFNSAANTCTIAVAGGSGDAIYGPASLLINESCFVTCVAADKWIINN